MAEKYGTVPPKFSREWWGYFWDYYKWHVIITVFALICVIVTVAQCASREKYDMHIIYAGNMAFTEEDDLKMEETVLPFVADADGNGEAALNFLPMTISGASGQEQYEYALLTKLDLSLQDDATFIYLFDKSILNNMINRKYVENIFVPVSDWGAEIADGMDIIKNEAGTAYAVDLTNSSFLNEKGVYCKDVYAVLRQNLKTDELNTKAYQSAVEILREFVK